MAPPTLIRRLFDDSRYVVRGLLAAGLVPAGLAQTLKSFSGYDAAERTRSKANWTTQELGPNTTVASAGPYLRARAQDLDRNNPHAHRGLSVLTRSVIGTGIEGRAGAAPARIQQQANAAWLAHGKRGVFDVEGQHTRAALTYYAMRAERRDGEAFVRRIWEPSLRPVPWRAQVLEASLLDETKTQALPDGGRIVQGIELNAAGRRVAYWFRTQHPAEALVFSPQVQSVRVPAEDVIHLFQPMRLGQLRGLPCLAPTMVTLRDMGDWQGHDLVRKKVETLVAAIVTPPAIGELYNLPLGANGQPAALTPLVANNTTGELVGQLAPGAVLTVENGTNVAFNNPQIGSNYKEFWTVQLECIAAGLEVTYADLSSDLGNTSWSSYRAGRIQFNALIDALQWLVVIPTLMEALWEWTMEGAYLTGALARPNVPAEWAPPKRLSVDPKSEAEADALEVRFGFALEEDKQAERGYRPSDFRERRKAEIKADAKAGVVYDTDPTRQTYGGAAPVAIGSTGQSSADAGGQADAAPLGDGGADAAKDGP